MFLCLRELTRLPEFVLEFSNKTGAISEKKISSSLASSFPGAFAARRRRDASIIALMLKKLFKRQRGRKL